MAKKFCAALVFVMVFSGMAFSYTYKGNDGLSWESAYIINSVEDMDTLADNADGSYYKLGKSITLTTAPRWSTQSYSFNGYLDGQGNTITYNNVSGMNYIFYSVSAPSSEIPALQNLNVNGTITDAASSGSCGGIIGSLGNGIVDKCTFTGTIRTNEAVAGGIAATISGGTIRNCTVSGTIRARTSAGGIAGEMWSDATIENCTVQKGTKISSTGSAGGIVGASGEVWRNNTIRGCVSMAELSEADDKGGIIGYVNYGGDVSGITGNTYTAGKAIGTLEDPVNDNQRIDGTEDSGNSSSDDDSSGCNSGFGVLLFPLIAVFTKKR